MSILADSFTAKITQEMNSTWYKRREESVRTSLKRFLLLYLGEPLHRLLRFVSVLIIRHDDYQNKTDLHGIKIPLMGHCTVKPRLTYTRFIRPASYPDVSLSLDENVRAKEGGKETTVSFSWPLAVHHQSLTFRARFYHAKNKAPEEEAGV